MSDGERARPAGDRGSDSAVATTQERPGWLSRLRARLGLLGAATVRDVIEEALEEGDGDTTFQPQEREMLQRILRFGDLRVADVMVPRADIIAIEEGAPLSDLLEEFKRGGHSRIPVYSETLDDLRGMIHIKDLMGWLMDESAVNSRVAGDQSRVARDEWREGDGGPAAAGPDGAERELSDSNTPPLATRHSPLANSPLVNSPLANFAFASIDLSKPISSTKIRRPVLFVPPSMPALNLLLRMQSTRIHLAMVVDEYGGTDGLVSIEDLVEEIVGQIEDEHDESEADLIVKDPVQGIIASARAPISDLEALLGIKILQEGQEADYDTLAGLVFSLTGRVPVRGELVHHPSGVEFEVLDADPRRLKKLKVHVRTKHAGAADPARGHNGAGSDEEG